MLLVARTVPWAIFGAGAGAFITTRPQRRLREDAARRYFSALFAVTCPLVCTLADN
jgi:hypothetical protein